MKKFTEQDFLDLVFAYGAEGDHADGWEVLSDAKKEVIACAWKDVEVTERDRDIEAGDYDYLPESFEAALAWYDDFIRAEEIPHA